MAKFHKKDQAIRMLEALHISQPGMRAPRKVKYARNNQEWNLEDTLDVYMSKNISFANYLFQFFCFDYIVRYLSLIACKIKRIQIFAIILVSKAFMCCVFVELEKLRLFVFASTQSRSPQNF